VKLEENLEDKILSYLSII